MKIGAQGENIAAVFLERKGFSIIDKNFRIKAGEIDIVALKGNTLHFVEVKTTEMDSEMFSRGTEMYRPEEKVDERKVKKIARVAEFYLAKKEIKKAAQIDVIAVYMDMSRKAAYCKIIWNVL